MNWDDYANFSEAEFACKCGCGRADMDPEFMGWLQSVRDKLAAPMMITSGFRCPDYNEQVSNTGRGGPHTTGKACDVGVRAAAALALIKVATAMDVHGLGTSQKGPHLSRFLHLDRCIANRPWVWSY